MMTALLLYGYCRGVFSSRKLEQACEERVDFMALTGMVKPDHSTICQFRCDHRVALSELFVQVLALCREAGMVKLGHVALDGTKVKADASKHSAMSYKRMMEAEPKLAKLVEEWMDQAKKTDEQEDREHGPDRRGDEIPAHIKDLTGSYPAQVSADAGYCSEANIVAREERKIDPYIATGRQKHGTASPTDEADKVAAHGRRRCERS